MSFTTSSGVLSEVTGVTTDSAPEGSGVLVASNGSGAQGGATTPKTVINVHPKVFAGFLTGLGVTAAGAVAAYVTPDSLAFLGVWAVPAAAAIGTGLGLLVSWLKKSES